MEAMESTMDEINIKLLVLGEAGVGKTSLVRSFFGEEIPKTYVPSIGNNIQHKEYILEKKKN